MKNQETNSKQSTKQALIIQKKYNSKPDTNFQQQQTNESQQINQSFQKDFEQPKVQQNQKPTSTPNQSSSQAIKISYPSSSQKTVTISKPESSQKQIIISFPKGGKTIIQSQKSPKSANTSKSQTSKKKQKSYQFKFSETELAMQEIAQKNIQITESKQFPIQPSETITENEHMNISSRLNQKIPKNEDTPIIVNQLSSIDAAIKIHEKNEKAKICVLNFADPFKPGGGYLNGRSPQEETLCRQTLLYPTLTSNTEMYEFNQEKLENVYLCDMMIYSPDVYVIRDDKYSELNEMAFKVNIISAPAVDCRKNNPFENAETIMERRIRKIISLAIDRGNDVIVLGAFGCGVFQNDPEIVSKIFKKILVDEKIKNYFELVVFPIYKSDKNFLEFSETFKNDSP